MQRAHFFCVANSGRLGKENIEYTRKSEEILTQKVYIFLYHALKAYFIFFHGVL